MRAVLQVALPVELQMLEGAEYQVNSYQVGDCVVTYEIPRRSDRTAAAIRPEKVLLNGKPAFAADVLVVEFRKAEFDRRGVRPKTWTG